MDIEQLRSFLAVVETGSISTAAHSLGIKQPALSKSIRRLEKQLGVELFVRKPRGVTPTDYGETLLHFALAMDSNYRSALRRIAALSDARSGELVIGAGGTWLEEQLPLAIARLVTERPAARILVITHSPETMLKQLLDGELDLLLAPLRAADIDRDELFTEALLVGDLVVMGRIGHPLAARSDVSLRLLAEARWALPRGAYIRERFDGMFVQQGLEPPTPAVEIVDSPGLFQIIANTDLLTYVPDLRYNRRSEGFAKIRSAQATVSRDTGLIWRRDQPLAPLAVELLTHLRACVRQAANSASADVLSASVTLSP
jgi:LysR family transcriptional regulator, regulator for genes of the gallate degradation pathway